MRPADTSADERTAVLVGVGTAQRGPGDAPDDSLEPVDLMVEAALAAARDALPSGATRALLAEVGMVAVPEGNWSYADPARLVAERIGIASARTVRVDIGVPQCTPIRVAVERIRAGELRAALVVGGEAKATQLRVTRQGGTPVETDQGDAAPDERWVPEGELMAGPEIDVGIWDPVAQYACIDNALRAAERRSVDEHLDQVAELWRAFNEVAGRNPDALFGEPRSAAELRAAGPGNRPLAFPYAKWHSTQWSVDQGAALLLCSVATARRLGVPADRWVHPLALVESSDAVSLSRRAEPHRWPAMQVLGAAVADHLGRPLRDIDHLELYSCFPAAVRVQQRELGLPRDGVPTLTGGMAFAGGPFNNFSYQATAAVVRALRAEPGTTGLVSTVSGLLTKPGLAVWSTRPGEGPPLLADLGEASAAATATVPVTGDAVGDGRVVTYTVRYDGAVPTSAFVVASAADGRHWIGTSDDPQLLARGVGDGPELIGEQVALSGTRCRLTSGASRPSPR